MELASSGSSFQSDLDFCPECGSVLPLPGAQDTLACTRCGFPVNVRGEGSWGSELAGGEGDAEQHRALVPWFREETQGRVRGLLAGSGERGLRLLCRPVTVFTACADLEGKVVKTSVMFHKLGTAFPVRGEEGHEFQGPVVSW